MTEKKFTPEEEMVKILTDKFYHDLYLNWYEAKEGAILSAEVFLNYLKEKEVGNYGKSDDVKYWENVIEIIKTC